MLITLLSAYFDAGIAVRFPGDQGIGNDPNVLFSEQFEESSVADLAKNWTEAKGLTDVLSLAPDCPPGSRGKTSLRMTATRGKNTGGHLWKLFKQGVDQMHARFYVKFSPDHPYIHHFVKIGAWKNSPNWPQGEAGKRHDGAKSFQTGIEPMSGYGKFDPPGVWNLYTYWCDMKSWQGPQGTSFYGNSFAPSQPASTPRNEWICVEFMVKANSAPDKADGEQAFWINGKLIGRWAPGTPTGKWIKDRFVMGDGEPFEGFRWRTDMSLKINTFWLLYYLESVFQESSQYQPRKDIPYNRDSATVWFDHVVVAKTYIGPIA